MKPFSLKRSGKPRTVTLLLVIGLLYSSPTYAFFSDGSGYAILSKMIALVKNSVEQLKTLKESLSVSEYLEEVEALKETKTIVEGSDQLKELVGEIQDTYDLSKEVISIDGMGIDELMIDLQDIKYQYELAQNLEGKEQIEAYIRTIQQFKRLRLLKESHQKNLEKISEGLNDREAARSTAHSMAMNTEILMRMEERQLREQAAKDKNALEEAAVQKALSGSYRSIGVMYGR